MAWGAACLLCLLMPRPACNPVEEQSRPGRAIDREADQRLKLSSHVVHWARCLCVMVVTTLL